MYLVSAAKNNSLFKLIEKCNVSICVQSMQCTNLCTKKLLIYCLLIKLLTIVVIFRCTNCKPEKFCKYFNLYTKQEHTTIATR